MSVPATSRWRSVGLSAPSGSALVWLGTIAVAGSLAAVVGLEYYSALAAVVVLVVATMLVARGPFAIFLVWLAFGPALDVWQGIKISQGLPSITFQRGMVFLLIASALLQARRGVKRPRVKFHPTDALLAVASIVRVLSILARPSAVNGELISAFTAFGVPLAAYLACRFTVTTWTRVRSVALVAEFVCLYLSVIAIYQQLTQRIFFDASGDGWAGGVFRSGSLTGAPWILGLILLMAHPWTMYVQSETRSRTARWLHRAVLGVTYAAMFFTYVRSIWIGAILQLFIRLYAFRADRKRIVVALLVGLALLVSAWATISATEGFRQRVANLYNLENRSDLAASQWALFVDKPVFGWGEGMGRIVTYVEGSTHVSHNTFLVIAVELGLVGLLPYVFGLLAAFRTSVRDYYRADSGSKTRRLIATYWAAFVGFLVVANAIDVTYFASALSLFGVAMALGVAAESPTELALVERA
jgi:O-antigen ligase